MPKSTNQPTNKPAKQLENWIKIYSKRRVSTFDRGELQTDFFSFRRDLPSYIKKKKKQEKTKPKKQAKKKKIQRILLIHFHSFNSYFIS